jgi:hypothetical protein
MHSQSCKSPSCWNFGTKGHLDVVPWRTAENTISEKVVASLEFGPW